MKRNNIFMWAYIACIVICIVVRLYWPFPLWESVVLAITVSSIFFAIEDFLSCCAQAQKEACDIAEEFIEILDEKLSECFEHIRMQDETVANLEARERDIFGLRETVDKVEVVLNHIKVSIEDDRKEIDERRDLQDKYEKASNGFAFFGFLFLFIILIFGVGNFTKTDEELVTVISFAIILATQQFKEISAEKIKMDKIENETALVAQREAKQSMIEFEDELATYVNYVDKLDVVEEDSREEALIYAD